MGKPLFLWVTPASLLYQGAATAELLATEVGQNYTGTGLVSSGHQFVQLHNLVPCLQHPGSQSLCAHSVSSASALGAAGSFTPCSELLGYV